MSFLVIDCGTSGCKAAVVTEDGRIRGLARHPVAVVRAAAGRAEIDPEDLWRAAVRTAGDALRRARIARDRVRGIGVSALLGYVLLDRGARPLGRAVIYMDTRAGAELAQITRRFPTRRLYRVSRRRPSAELLAPKLLWLRRHQPARWARLRAVIGLKDEIVRRLTGCVGTDLAHADYSLLFDIGKRRWDSEVLRGLGIHPEIFPEPTSAVQVAGGLSTGGAAALGLRAGIPVVRGSSDGTTAMYGGGVLQDGTAVLMTGTTDVLMTACRRLPADRSCTLTVNSGMVPGVWLAGGAMGLSGGAIRYLEGLMGADARRLSGAIGRLSPGTNGLVVLPGLTGERSPFWVDGLTGGVLGLTLGHGPEHLLRAAMEGTACRLVHLLDRLRRCGIAPQRLHVAGGWADVDAWNRIRADATGLDLRRLRTAEATLLGTAMFCRSAVDGVPLRETSREWVTLDRPFQPRAEQTARYRELANLFGATVGRAARRDDGLSA